MRVLAAILLVVVALAGCDSKPKEPPPDLLKGQRQQMDKARDVGNVLQQSNEQRREEIDKQGK